MASLRFVQVLCFGGQMFCVGGHVANDNYGFWFLFSAISAVFLLIMSQYGEN